VLKFVQNRSKLSVWIWMNMRAFEAQKRSEAFLL